MKRKQFITKVRAMDPHLSSKLKDDYYRTGDGLFGLIQTLEALADPDFAPLLKSIKSLDKRFRRDTAFMTLF